jgi:hypothetical protein
VRIVLGVMLGKLGNVLKPGERNLSETQKLIKLALIPQTMVGRTCNHVINFEGGHLINR